MYINFLIVPVAWGAGGSHFSLARLALGCLAKHSHVNCGGEACTCRASSSAVSAAST
jgi:hypothetical protein